MNRILNTKPIQFKLLDYNGEEIEGSFYLPEIQKVDVPADFEIEEIIEHKCVRGRTKYLVKWLGYPASMNQWVDQDDVRPL